MITNKMMPIPLATRMSRDPPKFPVAPASNGVNSIIGTICDISARTARVKLFTDPTSSIAVNMGGLKTVMKGNGENSARIEMSKRKIKVGEDVLALKKPGYLGEPMIIGQVAQCQRNYKSALLWDITVIPVCDVENIEDVTVIVMNPPD